MENFFDNKRILNSIWKWKFHIVVIVAITVVVSAIISGPFFITPKFKSTARVYPVNISEASEESESEHLLEYLQSSDIKFRVIDAFKLDEVYEISKDEKLYQTYMLYEYDQNISYKKTEFETVEVKVLDEDPQRAKVICDSIIVFLNDAVRTERQKKYFEFAQIAKRDLDKKTKDLDSLLAIVDEIRLETGLVDYFQQAETATFGLMEAAARGGDRRPAKEAISKLVNQGGKLRKYQELVEDLEVVADTLRNRYEQNMSAGTANISYTRLVERPFAADKKAYPIRWLIVFLSTVAATIVSVIAVAFIDYVREVKANL